VVALDSSAPDVIEGHVGRERYSWIREGFDEPDDMKILVIHHHLVPVPGTGRERNVIADAGDLLAALTQLDIDVVIRSRTPRALVREAFYLTDVFLRSTHIAETL
jgi:3',5'-cyclic AMP phosphodiesterase CpdA